MGRSIAQHLARRGDAVAIVDVNGEAAEQAAKEIREEGGRAVASQADVSDRGDVDRAMDTARTELGPVGILVTSAGVARFERPRHHAGLMEPCARDQPDRHLPLCPGGVTGYGRGKVGTCRSDLVVQCTAGCSPHGALRVVERRRDRSGEDAGSGICGLGYHGQQHRAVGIDTPMVHEWQAAGAVGGVDAMARNIPVGRVGTGDDIAAACAFLCSEEASYITGQTVSVNGGTYVT